MNRVLVSDPAGRYRSLAASLRRTVSESLRLLKLPDAEVSLLLTSDGEIARLNRRYRRKNRPTDVLSFPQEDRATLGDIAISVPTARRQARKAGHSLESECALLAIHGLLHLLGHDHAEPAEARRMFARQALLLAKAGPHA